MNIWEKVEQTYIIADTGHELEIAFSVHASLKDKEPTHVHR